MQLQQQKLNKNEQYRKSNQDSTNNVLNDTQINC
jgi:hypothetical protein